MTSRTDSAPPPAESQIELAISGMTCASCANRIERKLNKMDGVTATVNYATAKAKVTYAADIAPEELVSTVEKTGYGAALPPPPKKKSERVSAETEAFDPELDELAQRTLISLVLAAPVIVLAMVPAFQFDAWQWLSLTLAFPVVFYGGWPFHKAAWTNLRHGAATMDTLISGGTL